MRAPRNTPLPRQPDPSFSEDIGSKWKLLNAIASKPTVALLGVLGFMSWILWGKLDRVQEAQMKYVLTDSRTMLQALQNSTNATEKTNRILERMESKQ